MLIFAMYLFLKTRAAFLASSHAEKLIPKETGLKFIARFSPTNTDGKYKN